MSIVKKLPAVLIAAVGISFGVVGTALAEEMVIKVEKILVPEDWRLIFKPSRNSNMAPKQICFQTTDKLNGFITISAGRGEPDRLEATPTEQCISKSGGRIDILGSFPDFPGMSKSIRVYVKELP